MWLVELTDAQACATAAIDLLPKGSAHWYRVLGEVMLLMTSRGEYGLGVPFAEMLDEPAAEPLAARARVVAQARAALLLLYAGACERAANLLIKIDVDSHNIRDDPSTYAEILFSQCCISVFTGDDDDLIALYEELIKCYQIAGNLRQKARHEGNLGDIYRRCGAHAAAVDVLRATLVDAERMGLRHVVAAAQLALSLTLAQLGELDEALSLVAEAISVVESGGDRRMEAYGRAYLAEILLLSGALERAADEARLAIERARDIPTVECYATAVLASVLLKQGQAMDALKVSERAIKILGSVRFVEEGAELARLVHAEALQANGDSIGAAAVVAHAREELLRRAERMADGRRRASYLENVPENARTLRLARELLGD